MRALLVPGLALLLSAAPSDFIIVPGKRFGPVTEDTTRAMLAARFGNAAVRDAQVTLGEGSCTDGLRVFPGTQDEIDIAWQGAAAAKVAFVRASQPGGRWTKPRGIRIGVSLRRLRQLAGKPLQFHGFGWDYAGTMQWIEREGELLLRMEIAPGADPKLAASPGISGDRIVNSDHPAVRRLPIRTGTIIQRFGAAPDADPVSIPCR